MGFARCVTSLLSDLHGACPVFASPRETSKSSSVGYNWNRRHILIHDPLLIINADASNTCWESLKRKNL